MDFTVAVLKQAVARAIQDHRDEHMGAIDNRIQREADARAQWCERYLPEWQVAAKRISARVRKGEPVTAEDLPRGNDRWDSRARLYDPIAIPNKADYRAPSDLINLMAILETIEGSVVTTNALRQLGVTPQALGRAVGSIR